MPRHFSQADYNKSSPSPHDVSLEATGSTSTWNNASLLESSSPFRFPLNIPQSCQSSRTQGNKSQYTTPDNTSNLPPPGSKSKLITPDNHNPRHPSRQSSEKSRSRRQPGNESIASQFHINMTRMEELFPDYSRGSVDDFSPPATLPNAKELVSGVFQDGTPVFSPHAKKPRASRFVSASNGRDHSTTVDVPTAADVTPQLEVKKPRGSRFGSASHSKDVSLKVEPAAEEPFDSKRALALLDVLEKKVAALEKHRAQDEMTIQQLQLENRISRAESKERRKYHRSDSALGSTDGGSERGDDMGSRHRKLLVENNRLEDFIRTLQEQITLLNQAASESEINLDQIAKDRDSAVSQLGAAYFTVEQLKAENQTLQERNSMLKRSVDQLIANQDDTTMDMTAREEALDKEFERRRRVEAKERELEKQQRLEKRLATTQPDSKIELPSKEIAPESETFHKGQITRSGSISSQSSISDNDSTNDLTYLSVASAGDVGELRKTIERERIARSKKRATCKSPTMEPIRRQVSKTGSLIDEKASSDDAAQQLTSTRKSPLMEPIRRRVSNTGSSIEKGSSDDGSQRFEPTRKSSGNQPDPQREYTSAMSIGSHRGNDNSGNVSDWISHEITLDWTGYEGRPPPTPSREAEIPYHEDLPPIFTRRVEEESSISLKEPKVLPKPAPVVKQTMEFPKPTPVAKQTTVLPKPAPVVKQTMEFPKPTPVAEQASVLPKPAPVAKQTMELPKPAPVVKQTTEPAPYEYEEEPTLRPSQAPELALASVIKGLEDELSLAKRQFAQYQDLYNNQNPALARRARKSLKDKMEVLLRTIDGKADYIYSLYDVVEGQKQQDQGMSERRQDHGVSEKQQDQGMSDERMEAILKSCGAESKWADIRSETQKACSAIRSRRSS